jgi:Protein of unknown function (DUF2905)
MDSDVVGRCLLIFGLAVALVGAALLLFARIPFIGRLPADISFQRDGFSFFFPIVTCIVLSVILTIAVNLFVRVLR